MSHAVLLKLKCFLFERNYDKVEQWDFFKLLFIIYLYK